jgi:hypothetical protein
MPISELVAGSVLTPDWPNLDGIDIHLTIYNSFYEYLRAVQTRLLIP